MERVLRNEQEVEKEPGRRRALSVQASLMTPVQPMLVRLLLWPHSRCSDLPCEIWRIGARHSADVNLHRALKVKEKTVWFSRDV